jgi:hypothetical protein
MIQALAFSLALAVDLDRAPYLQSTSPTSTHVVWWTQEQSEGTVHWGAAGSDADQSRSSALGIAHDVEITGLAPNTTYDYRVEDGDGVVLGGGSITTSPAAGEPARMRLWAIGDSGTGGDHQRDVYDAFIGATNRELPLVMLHLGDSAYDSGTHQELSDNFFGVYAEFLGSATAWPTFGNHEAVSSASADQSGPYFEAFVLPAAGELGGMASGTEAYYSFDYGNVHVIVLDSSDSDREAAADMGQWIVRDLQANTLDWVIATFHHAPYSRGPRDSDENHDQIAMREELVPLLEDGGVDLVLSGHSHLYERSFLLDGAYETPTTDAGILVQSDGALGGDGPYTKPQGVTAHSGTVYVVAGHGGASTSGDGGHPVMAFDEQDYGSVLIDIDDDHMTVRNLRVDGVVSDEFTLVKGDDLVLHGPDGETDYEPGVVVPIEWTAIGDIGPVDVEWTCDGEFWQPLALGVDVSDSYLWTTPEIGTQAARVRISAGDESDTSDAPFGISRQHTEVAISNGAIWKYSDQDGELPPEWVDGDYNDSAWAQGPAELGFGDDDEATEIAAGQPTFYFRHTFSVDGSVLSANLTILFDDGAAVWLNGALVAVTSNIDVLDYEAYAEFGLGDNREEQFELAVSEFRPGDNTLAVLIKQADADSSDVSFDLALEVQVVDRLDDCPDQPQDTDETADTDDTDDTPQVQESDGCCSGDGSSALFLFLIPLFGARRFRGR